MFSLYLMIWYLKGLSVYETTTEADYLLISWKLHLFISKLSDLGILKRKGKFQDDKDQNKAARRIRLFSTGNVNHSISMGMI